MLDADLDEPVPLDVVKDYPISMAIMAWNLRKDPLPVSGDPFFNKEKI